MYYANKNIREDAMDKKIIEPLNKILERFQLKNYHMLLKLVTGESVFLEEYARNMISDEETYISEVEKMLRKPG
jgi:hypothetical protein